MSKVKKYVSENGDVCWKLPDGKYHRNPDKYGRVGPAVIQADGVKKWYQYGKLHRHPDMDRPAAIYPDGSKMWYQYGLVHRDNGRPAVTFDNTWKNYYHYGMQHLLPDIFDNVRYSYDDVRRLTYKNGSSHCYMDLDGRLIPSIFYTDTGEYAYRVNEECKLHRIDSYAIYQNYDKRFCYNGVTVDII